MADRLWILFLIGKHVTDVEMGHTYLYLISELLSELKQFVEYL